MAAQQGCGVVLLNRGAFSLVDEENMEWLDQARWHVDDKGYAAGVFAGKMQRMHCVILQSPRGIDHKSRDRLDNRKQNLRPATKSQNGGNMKTRSLGTKTSGGLKTSRYKGVHLDKCRGGWRVSGILNRKEHYLGRFDSEEEAARAYNQWATVAFGEFAALNNVPSL